MAKLRKFITHDLDAKIKDLPKDIQALIKKGKQQNFVTEQEVQAAFGDNLDNLDLMDQVYEMFFDLGVDVVSRKKLQKMQLKNLEADSADKDKKKAKANKKDEALIKSVEAKLDSSEPSDDDLKEAETEENEVMKVNLSDISNDS